MSQAPVNQNDPRSRYTHQAYDVTYLGKSQESGPSGRTARLSATYTANILLPYMDAGSTATVTLGDLTQGLIITGLINHVALSTGTINLTLPAHGGLGAVTMIAAGSLTSAGVITLTTPVLAPLTIDRPLTGAIAAGTASETAILSLLVTPIEAGWK